MLIQSPTLKGLQCSWLLTSLFFLAACGESAQQRITPHGDTVYILGSENEASKVVRDWNVICQDPLQCPNSVGQLVMKVGREISVCTATLIGVDTAITNSHCFDFHNQQISVDEICDTGVALVFASNSSLGREVVECKSVVAKSSIKSGAASRYRDPDFMMIRLKRSVTRGFEKFDFGGLQEGMKLRIPKVNPQGVGSGLLVTDSCEVLYGTYLLPSAADSLAPVHILKGCHIIGGNSGSALFDSNGLIRGLIFATLVLDKLENPDNPLSPGIVKTLRQVKPSFATNAACISHLDGHNVPSRCSQGRTDKENEMALKDSQQELMNRLTQDLLNFQASPHFGYEIRQSRPVANGETVLVYRPACLRRGYETNQYTSAPVLKWTVTTEFTEKLKFALQIRSESTACNFKVHTIGRNQAVVYADQEFCQASNDNFIVPGESWATCP